MNPRISFGIIVLNGEPFTRYCLRSLYPYAYEIIVVEGGHEDAKIVCTPDGHSIDGTLEILRRFKEEEDPENKLQIITREGFWTKRDELGRDRTHQSRAYAERATGDYLWQVDIDEFYHPRDMEAILNMLKLSPSISAVSFKTLHFWCRPEYLINSWRFRRGEDIYHRLFKWGPGYRYVTHEPPTVSDSTGLDLRRVNWRKGSVLAHRGIYLYHYSQLFPWQMRQKALVYKNEKPDSYNNIEAWLEKSYFHLKDPYHIERYYWSPSWLERNHHKHPPEILRMMEDIRSGQVNFELRSTQDVEQLMTSRSYLFGRIGYKVLDYLDRFWLWMNECLIRASHIPKKLVTISRRLRRKPI